MLTNGITSCTFSYILGHIMLYALLVILQTNQCYITMGYSCPLLRGTFLERPSYLFLTIRRCTKCVSYRCLCWCYLMYNFYKNWNGQTYFINLAFLNLSFWSCCCINHIWSVLPTSNHYWVTVVTNCLTIIDTAS